MAEPKLVLGIARVSRNARIADKGASSSALVPELKQKLFERDHCRCQFCGFVSQKYQDIHFINGNQGDQRPENMRTCCIFCHQCFELDRVGSMRSGVLVWAPEISQAALHHLARAIYVARISQGPVAEAARKSLDTILQRREDARQRIGTDDPSILALVLRDYISSKTYEMREQKLEGVRLFPLDRRIIKEGDLEFNQFPQILAYWRSKDGPFGGRQPKDWTGIYKNLTGAAAAA